MIYHAEKNDTYDLINIRRRSILGIESSFYNFKQKKSWIDYNDITDGFEVLESKILDPSWKILIYKQNYSIVGYSAFDLATSLITSIYILPGYQKKGIGAMLLNEILTGIDSDVFVLSSKVALPLYQKNGFNIVEVKYMMTISEQLKGYWMVKKF